MCEMKVAEVERILIAKGYDIDAVKEYARTQYQFMKYSSCLNPMLENDIEEDFNDWMACKVDEEVML